MNAFTNNFFIEMYRFEIRFNVESKRKIPDIVPVPVIGLQMTLYAFKAINVLMQTQTYKGIYFHIYEFYEMIGNLQRIT